jgi:hypothetical protein
LRPAHTTRLSTGPLSDKEDRDIYHPEAERYRPPVAFKIDNENVSPITVRQFFTEFHVRVYCNMEEIKRVNRMESQSRIRMGPREESLLLEGPLSSLTISGYFSIR